jgi:hypothetical protein
LFDWLVGWLVGQLAGQCVGYEFAYLLDGTVALRCICSLSDWLVICVVWLFACSASWSATWLVGWLAGCLVGWWVGHSLKLIGWDNLLIGCWLMG